MRSPALANEPLVCSVTDLTLLIKQQLEETFSLVWLGGEISNFTQAGSGHWYFNVKDADACIRAVVWRSTVQRLRVKLKDGMQVVGRGKLSVYPPRGEYQLVFDEIHPQGLGAQDLALRQLKEKLHKLGWFAAERKKPLPKFPRCIAIASSPSGAAIRDMIEILSRRWPIAEIYVCPIRVQGDGAPQTIVHALKRLNKLHCVDVILLGRGGGSSDDLAAFNDERVAKAIHDSRIPIVSAVGHETDVTIADLVADRRALTPSEAAELAAPDRKDLLESLARQHRRLNDLLQHRFRFLRHRMGDLASRRCFRAPLDALRDRERRLDELRQRMDRAVRAKLARAEHQLQHAAARLQALSPLNVLARGYSLTRSAEGHVIASADQARPGEAIEILLADGMLTATVDSTIPGKTL
jgi:exodeoxyribonuclease VII large subunit